MRAAMAVAYFESLTRGAAFAHRWKTASPEDAVAFAFFVRALEQFFRAPHGHN